uniref:Uncharacterized protein n=1 Tax=Anguilla anguilla TaxID=7936 RepID=A0A0E9V115_ANGAN
MNDFSRHQPFNGLPRLFSPTPKGHCDLSDT